MAAELKPPETAATFLPSKRIHSAEGETGMGVKLIAAGAAALFAFWGSAMTGGTGDGRADAQPQQCLGRAVTIVATPGQVTYGTARADVIVGTSGPDDIRSRGGNDRICARGGDDTIRSGGGRDRVAAGGGRDLVIAGGGNDIVKGNGGNDTLRGNRGDDTINGGRGTDECVGGTGDDSLTSCNEANAPAPSPLPDIEIGGG